MYQKNTISLTRLETLCTVSMIEFWSTTYLLLKCEYMRNAAIDRVLNPGLSFVGDGHSSLTTVRQGEIGEEFGDIASTKHLVNCSKMGCTLLMAEVRCKHTPSNALPPQELARSAWRSKPRHNQTDKRADRQTSSVVWLWRRSTRCVSRC